MKKDGRSARFNMRAPPEWVAAVKEEADKYDISAADWIMMASQGQLPPMKPISGPQAKSRKPRSQDNQ